MSRWRPRTVKTIIILTVLSALRIGVAASPDTDQQGIGARRAVRWSDPDTRRTWSGEVDRPGVSRDHRLRKSPS